MSTRDAKSVEVLDVLQNERRVASLRRTTRGCVFEFDDAFFAEHRGKPGGLARHLPYAQKSIVTEGDNLPPYFAGLLPEGRRLSSLLARSKTSEDDLFTLLVAAGPNCVGELFPVLPGAKGAPLDEHDEPRPLDRLSFSEVFADVLDADAPAIPGVQEKLSPSLISFPFSTSGRKWILKLNPPDRERLVENEHFFMTMADACGLPVARTHLVRDRTGASGLLVERFDRVRVERRWRGVRQEDACQLLDRYPADKYRIKTSEVMEALDVCTAPLVERAQLIDQLAFSYLVGNGDLHAKNVSVTLRTGALKLSPAYDLLSTRPWKDTTLAMQLEGRDDNVKRRDLLALGQRFGIRAAALHARLDRLLAAARPFRARLGELGYDARLTRALTAQLEKRLGDLAR
jgi:serine/threonine-protein kinase HipA